MCVWSSCRVSWLEVTYEWTKVELSNESRGGKEAYLYWSPHIWLGSSTTLFCARVRKGSQLQNTPWDRVEVGKYATYHNTLVKELPNRSFRSTSTIYMQLGHGQEVFKKMFPGVVGSGQYFLLLIPDQDLIIFQRPPKASHSPSKMSSVQQRLPNSEGSCEAR